MEDDLEEELLAVAGRSRVGSKKRSRKDADSSDEDYGTKPLARQELINLLVQGLRIKLTTYLRKR
jgi:hypothetical protein